MTVIEALNAERFRSLAADAASIYGEAMHRSPEIVIQRRDVIAVHVSYRGFVASGAFDTASGAFDTTSGAFDTVSGAFDTASGSFDDVEQPAEVPAPLVGFGYGYRGAPGQWWHDIVAGAIGRSGTQRWLHDGFELAELHVLPDHQGHGLGRTLLADVLDRADADHAVLSTPDSESTARLLYRSYGFIDLCVGFRFPGSPEAYAIMGVDL
jgi:ribosomal protein S18 acetylase RimI-like enzyme